MNVLAPGTSANRLDYASVEQALLPTLPVAFGTPDYVADVVTVLASDQAR